MLNPLKNSIIQAILAINIKKAGAIFDAESVAGKFTGYSESWRKDSFPAEKLVTLMEFVKDMEERTK